MEDNQFGVVLEEIRDMFRVLADGHEVLKERLDCFESELKERLVRIETRLDKLDWRQGIVEDALRKLVRQLATSENEFEGRLNDHEDRLVRLETLTGIR
ncbi:MAG: hypothetical protein PWQ18_438 [Clostridia bacterium]|nr:hypothetical protein [Clostridia bacterium]